MASQTPAQRARAGPPARARAIWGSQGTVVRRADRPPMVLARCAGRGWFGCSQWLGRCLACDAREWGSTEGGSGVLQVGGAFVQYSCSRHNPRPVDPHPRAVDLLGAGAGWGRCCVGAAGTLSRNSKGSGGGRAGESETGPGVRAPGPSAKVPRRRPHRQPSVHSADIADINDPAVEALRKDRWNSAVPPWRAAPVQS